MYSLFIDTHFTNVNIIIYKDSKVIFKEELESKQSHSIVTMPLLRTILEDNNLSLNDMSEIIVVNGPGSFTGVRIGVTIAKTISYCLNIPIKVISSLEVLASNVTGVDNKIVAFNDRNGYFIGEFNKDNKLLKDYYYLSNNEYLEFSNNNKVFDKIDIIDYNKAYEFVKSKEYVNPHNVKPLYVKKIEVLK